MLKYCTKCWTPNTRPRITFNNEGVCNACQWAEEKKKVNWDKRHKFLEELCDKYRGNGNSPDVIVPWSGGKDSIHVAYKMREIAMTPILATLIPHLETKIGKWNRTHLCPDWEKVTINHDVELYRKFAKEAFVKHGRPKHPFVTGISSSILKFALKVNIPFIMYGEEGEQEYGGSSREKDRWSKPMDLKYLREFYYSGHNPDEYGHIWKLPPFEQMKHLFSTQMSRFEDWRPSDHAHEAVLKGMRTNPVRNIGTFTGTAQLSDKLQDLHAYMMFVKFGFGRCTSDVGIGIREGWVNRDSDGLEWIEAYDGEFPNGYLQEILENIGYIWNLKEWAFKWRRKGTPVELISPNRGTMQRRTYLME
jgi:N-acetyl sugar amidotransferase